MTALFSLSWCFPFSRVLLKEGDSCSAGQEIYRLIWNPKVYYRVHRSSPLNPILSQMNSVHILTSFPL